MTPLATNSDQAVQLFTFHCTGVPAWYDQELSSLDNALKLMGSNEHVFRTEELSGVSVLYDECRVMEGILLKRLGQEAIELIILPTGLLGHHTCC